MTSGSAIAAAGVLLAALCASGQTSAKGYRTVPESELPLHKPTGITFPATAGTLPRKWVRQTGADPRAIRVGYGLAAWLEISPSGGSAATKLTSMKRTILLRHSARIVDPPAAIGGLFPGWETAILMHRASETGVPPKRGERLRRDFVAARRCGAYMLSVRAWTLDTRDTEQLRRLGEAMGQIFGDPGAGPGRGFACD